MRLFTGISLPDILLSPFTEFRQQNKSLEGIRWVKLRNHHITTCFIGKANEEVAFFEERIGEVVSGFSPFTLEFDKVNFSPGKKPYMIWAYFKPQEEFSRLSKELHQVLELEVPSRQEPIPHITLARFKKPHYYFKPKFPIDMAGEKYMINHINLYESKTLQKGAEYSVLRRFDF